MHVNTKNNYVAMLGCSDSIRIRDKHYNLNWDKFLMPLINAMSS